MARKTTLDELGEMLAHVVHNMATKDDIADLRRDVVADITRLDTKIDRLEISITRELDGIKQQLANVIGFGKEIDHALERIAAIEKHLGINQKIAA